MATFKIYRPLKTTMSQGFGIEHTDPVMIPVYNKLGLEGHNGHDYACTHGHPIYATHDGMAYYEIDADSGHGVVIRTNEQYDGCFYKTIYWHLCNPHNEPQYTSPVSQYQIAHQGAPMPVKAGDVIGYGDSTGQSTGDHLHFGVKPCLWNEEEWTWYNTQQNNGYKGAVDPALFYTDQYAEDIATRTMITVLQLKVVELCKKLLAKLYERNA